MSYEPFLIAPFQNGLDIDMQPWLLPQDAFSEIENGHIRHGVLQKRNGYQKQGDLVHKNGTDWDITAITAPGATVTITVTDSTGLTTGDTVEIRGVNGMTQLNGHQYTITVAGNNLTLDNVDGTDFDTYTNSGGVYLIAGERVMGIENFIDSQGVKEQLAWDTKRVCTYNTNTEQYDPLVDADIFSSSDTDYVWVAPWSSVASTSVSALNRIYFTNGKSYSAGPPVTDGIWFYDGTNVTSFRPEINTGSGRYINGARLIFTLQGRLLLFATTEGSDQYWQRMRWCQAQNPGIPGSFDGEWDDSEPGKGGYVDAPTGDRIVTGGFIENQIVICMTNSVWLVQPTADPALPFIWKKINNFRAADAKMSVASFDRYVVSAGIRGITATDGIETTRIDNRIEDFTTSIVNSSEFDKIFAERNYENRAMWMLYPNTDSDDCDAALIFDEESKAWSTYTIAMNVLGHGGVSKDASLQDFGDLGLQDPYFDDSGLQDFWLNENSELMLGGDTSGTIHTMNVGSTDNIELFESGISSVTQASEAVVTIDGDKPLADFDRITISGIGTGSMTELNDREFLVSDKTGNQFKIKEPVNGVWQYVDSTGYTAYNTGLDRGTVRADFDTDLNFKALSAAWNPYISRGMKAQMGYVDVYLQADPTSQLDVRFYANDQEDYYARHIVHCLPDLIELGTVSDISNANPAVVTSPRHGLNTGAQIYLYGCLGMPEINGGPYTVTAINTDTFSLDGVDSTNYGLYTQNGIITKNEFSSQSVWKRIYAGGTGFQHRMEIYDETTNAPVNIFGFMPWFRPRTGRPR